MFRNELKYRVGVVWLIQVMSVATKVQLLYINVWFYRESVNITPTVL